MGMAKPVVDLSFFAVLRMTAKIFHHVAILFA